MGMYQPEIETMDRNELEKLQLERLQKQVKNVYENVPMYRERMDKKGVKPEDIKELKDLAKLPFTTKQDLRDYYPFELFAADKKDIVRIHASSGTTGRQIVAGYTRNDLDMWADCMARQIAAAGGNENSVVQVSYGYGLFTGGLGAHGGSERIGAMTIPTSSGNTERQIRLMIELGATHLCCTPSYAMYLGETINEMGVKDQLSLKAGIFGAEPWTEDMRHQIEQSLGIKAYDVYGLTEITGPGVSYECSAQNGMHVCEDMFIPEIIDPDTEEVLPPGSFGELVFTTITKEGMPMMRYRTREMCIRDRKEIEQEFGLRHSTIIGLLKRMEKNNFVRVEVNPEDHRCRQVILFDKAFELGSEMKEHRKYMDSLITGALNDEEEKELKKLLTKVYEHMYQDNDKCEK